jgi:hypothetical protein
LAVSLQSATALPQAPKPGRESPIQNRPLAEAQAQLQIDLAAFDAEVLKQRSLLLKLKDSECKGDVEATLARLCELDQLARTFLNTHKTRSKDVLDLFLPRLERLDSENRDILKSLIDRWGWFRKTDWGEKADSDAWLLAQHSDKDVPFQKRVLGMLEPLLASGDTSRQHYAYLFDRVAVNEGRPQRYGTQGFCTGPGTWSPRRIEDHLTVDSRRRDMGLSTLADYISTFRSICREDETQLATGSAVPGPAGPDQPKIADH